MEATPNRLNGFLRFFQYVLDTGVHDRLPEQEKRRIRVLNVMNAAIFGFSLIFSVAEIGYYHDLSIAYIIADGFTLPASLISLWLTSRRYYTAAKLEAIILNILVLVYMRIFLGDSGMELAGLICLVGSIFLFESNALKIAMSLFSIASYFVLNGNYSLDTITNPPITLMHQGAILLLIFLILYSIQREMTRFHKTVSKQKNLLIARNRELHETNALKTKLFSILSHDLRGPLSAFELYLKEIKNTNMDPEEFQKMCPELLKNVETMNLLIQNLLRWSQDELTKRPLNIETVDLTEKIEENFRVLELQANLKNIRLRMEVPPRGAAALADANVVDTVLRNLLSNAIKFSLPGSNICVYVFSLKNKVSVCVEDYGKGMTPSQIQGILEGTGQTTYGTHMEKGSGLGLVLIRQLLQKHGSRLEIESKIEKGTRISFDLPKANALSVAV